MSPALNDAQHFARISRELMAGDESQATLQRIAELAVATIGPCDYAGVSLRHRSRLHTPAYTDEVVTKLDAMQYELGEGPGVTALQTGDTTIIQDMSLDRRWPRWASFATELGVNSALGVSLANEGHLLGSLNLYSRQGWAYTGEDMVAAHVYATHAAGALQHSLETEGLRVALRTRHLIGMAQGIIMARLDVDEEQAFAYMRRTSQHRNVKVRELAEEIVTRRGLLDGHPTC